MTNLFTKWTFALLFGICMCFIAACASSQQATSGDLSQTYTADFEATVSATAKAISSVGLSNEEGVALGENRYLIVAYREAREASMQDARLLTLRVYVAKTGPERTTVRVKVPSESVGGYGSGSSYSYRSAERYAKRIFINLNSRLVAVSSQ